MRLISILCVVLVMALNMVPCADAHEPEIVNSIANNAPNTHDDHTEDACTPFCHCSCCAASVVLKMQNNLAVPFYFQQISPVPHLEANSIEISLSVWQPPKLA